MGRQDAKAAKETAKAMLGPPTVRFGKDGCPRYGERQQITYRPGKPVRSTENAKTGNHESYE